MRGLGVPGSSTLLRGRLGGARLPALAKRGDVVVCVSAKAQLQPDLPLVQIDVTDKIRAQMAVLDVDDRMWGVDVKAHTAGIIKTAPFLDLGAVEIVSIIDVHLMRAVSMAQAVSQVMI